MFVNQLYIKEESLNCLAHKSYELQIFIFRIVESALSHQVPQ